MELFQTPGQLREADFEAQAEMERRRAEARDRRMRIPEPETLKRREKIAAELKAYADKKMAPLVAAARDAGETPQELTFEMKR